MPIECERLQGFPDRWTEGFSDSTRYKMLGNAVAVPLSEWIGRRILLSDSAIKAT
jgi:DNA (cytosine-5)-methyltransferase 1